MYPQLCLDVAAGVAGGCAVCVVRRRVLLAHLVTAFNSFTFFGYRLRPAQVGDLPLAAEWNAKDEDHAGRVEAEFWIRQGPGQDAYVLADDGNGQDHALFFLKLCAQPGTAMVELHIQFDPGVGAKARAKRREALTEGFSWLERTLKMSGVQQIFFRSRNSGLILFSQKRLGFTPDPLLVEGEATLRKILSESPPVVQ